MKDSNWYLMDRFLVIDDSYSYIKELDDNLDIKAFIIGLFEITDEFNYKSMHSDKEALKTHLNEVKKYIDDNEGTSYKLARDIQIAIYNLDSDFVKKGDYYQDLLKLRAAVKFD